MKRRRAENMSETQRELLYELVNSNEKLQNDQIDGFTVTRLTKRKELVKVALNLNSAAGPQKTWSQWKKVPNYKLSYYPNSNCFNFLKFSVGVTLRSIAFKGSEKLSTWA